MVHLELIACRTVTPQITANLPGQFCSQKQQKFYACCLFASVAGAAWIRHCKSRMKASQNAGQRQVKPRSNHAPALHGPCSLVLHVRSCPSPPCACCAGEGCLHASAVGQSTARRAPLYSNTVLTVLLHRNQPQLPAMPSNQTAIMHLRALSPVPFTAIHMFASGCCCNPGLHDSAGMHKPCNFW